MSGLFTMMAPAAGTNRVLNPSAEAAGNYTTVSGLIGPPTITRVTDLARHGIYCYKLILTETNQGIALTTPALSNAVHAVSCYAIAPADIQSIMVSCDGGSHYNLMTALRVGAIWTHYIGSVPAIQCNGSTATLIKIAGTGGGWGGGTFYLDGVQVEAGAGPTTYIDGDQPGCTWAGEFHASASTRDALYRGGGAEVNLDDYGVTVFRAVAGLGLPPITNNLQDYALLPGAQFQSTRIQPRIIDLVVSASATTLAGLLAKRQALIDLLSPIGAYGVQPIRLGYWGNPDRPVYLNARYVQGLQFANVEGFIEQPVIRLLCEDPFWYEDDQEQAALDYSQSVSDADFALRRDNGEWQSLGTGFSGGGVNVIAIDQSRGRIYFGGSFTSANGVSVNRICYWNGSTFVALGSGLNASVISLAIAPNGDVWVGGEFGTAGGSTAYGLARWNVAAETWTGFTNGVGTTYINAIAIDHNNNVYIGGYFTNFDGIAAADYVAKYNGSTWAALGTSPFDVQQFPRRYHSLACDADGNLYAGSRATTGPATVCALYKWNGATWTTIGSTDSIVNSGVNALAFDAGGNLYIGGRFGSIGGVTASNVALWNGQAFIALGSGVGVEVHDLVLAGDVLYVGANAVGLASADFFAAWNGSVWIMVDVDLPATSLVLAMGALGERLFIGFDQGGTATAAAINTVTCGSTIETYPIVTFVGPGTLEWLENQTTGKRLYLNLTAQAGETITIDLRTGAKTIVSDWRGSMMTALLPNSDFGSWHLAPGANTIAAYVTGSSGATMLIMRWTPVHGSVDGVHA